MYSRTLRVGHAVLAYDVQGQGSRALLLFHGAGQDRTVFHHLPESIKATYRIYAFDLFFHGESEWNSSSPVSKSDWKALLTRLCEDEQVDTWSVLGYSIGARFALATAEMFPRKTKTCFLVAPDGIADSPWFSLSTSTAVGRWIFHYCTQSPTLVPKTLHLASKFRLIDPDAGRFIEHQLNNTQKRERIYRVWTLYRDLSFDLDDLAETLAQHAIVVRAYVGTRDLMIRTEPIRKFLKRLKSAHLEVIDANHRRILSNALERIGKL